MKIVIFLRNLAVDTIRQAIKSKQKSNQNYKRNS